MIFRGATNFLKYMRNLNVHKLDMAINPKNILLYCSVSSLIGSFIGFGLRYKYINFQVNKLNDDLNAKINLLSKKLDEKIKINNEHKNNYVFKCYAQDYLILFEIIAYICTALAYIYIIRIYLARGRF